MDHHHSGEPSSLMHSNAHQHPQPSPHHGERSFLILKRKLATLKYTEHLDTSSCALVARLVDDLIRTTESYQSLKVQEHQKEMESNAYRSKVGWWSPLLCTLFHSFHSAVLLMGDCCCRQKL